MCCYGGVAVFLWLSVAGRCRIGLREGDVELQLVYGLIDVFLSYVVDMGYKVGGYIGCVYSCVHCRPLIGRRSSLDLSHFFLVVVFGSFACLGLFGLLRGSFTAGLVVHEGFTAGKG